MHDGKRSKAMNGGLGRWMCETIVREVVEEAMVECVDVRNYFRRPPHHTHHLHHQAHHARHADPLLHSRMKDDGTWSGEEGEARSQDEPSQSNPSISAKVSLILSTFYFLFLFLSFSFFIFFPFSFYHFDEA